MSPLKRVHADLENRDYCNWIEFLRNAEGWDRIEIEDYQYNEIQSIVQYAFDNFPGYRKLYEEAGISSGEIHDMEDFQKLPFIEKDMIRDRLEEFSLKTQGSKYVTTGGSTGIPMGFYRHHTAFSKELASKAHQYYRVGWNEGDSQFVLRGIPIKNNIQFFPRFNELRCSSYHLTAEWIEKYCRRAIKHDVKWIRCYPSTGYLFANYIKETGYEFPELKGILCASENLYDFQKKLISEVFGVRVFSHYGHFEQAALAGFCEHEDTYHVLPFYGYAELIGPDGEKITKPGEMGEIVGTSFSMRSTPFIRYKTKDFAVLTDERCSTCGRPYQIWDKIEGRLQEFILTTTNRYISMTAVNMHDDIFDKIRQFQFLQEKKGEVTFKYIPKNSLSQKIVDTIKQRLVHKIGPDVVLNTERVSSIPLTPRGKHRFLIQKLPLKIYHDK